MSVIADVQSTPDTRNQPIARVGISRLRQPVILQTAAGEQTTVAEISMAVYLPAEQKGTHMSRFVALIQAYSGAIGSDSLRMLTYTMLRDLASDAGEIVLRCPFFRIKTAPVSGIKSLMDYDLTLKGEIEDGQYRQTVKIVVPVTSLCPCSKEISNYGAHNQRSHVTVSLTGSGDMPLVEEIIDSIEQQASCQLYGLLKRPDEKYVTEYAYDHPKFVEDIVRDVAAALKADTRVHAFVVESENFESIHNHSAYAKVVYP